MSMTNGLKIEYDHELESWYLVESGLVGEQLECTMVK